MRIVFLCILVLSMSNSLFASGNKELYFRPVTLKIIDAVTGEALEGVKVYSVDVTFYREELRIFGVLIGETKDIKTDYIREYTSDKNGHVYIPEVIYFVKDNNFIYEQSIYINYETVEDYNNVSDKALSLKFGLLLYKTDKNEVYMPMKEFKAYWILNRPYPMDNSWNQPDKTKSYYTQINNGHDVPRLSKKEMKLEPTSFYCEEEEFIIRLERQGQ